MGATINTNLTWSSHPNHANGTTSRYVINYPEIDYQQTRSIPHLHSILYRREIADLLNIFKCLTYPGIIIWKYTFYFKPEIRQCEPCYTHASC